MSSFTLLVIKTISICVLLSCYTQSAPPHNYTLHEFKDFHGKSQIKFTSQGDTILKNAVHSEAGLSNFHDVLVRKKLDVRNAIHSGGNLIVDGEAKIENLNVISNLKGNGAHFDGSVQVKDNVTAQSSMHVMGHLSVAKNVELSTGQLSIGSHVTISSNGNLQARFLNSTGDVHVAGNLKNQGDTITLGKTTSNNGFYTKDGTVKAKEVEVIDSVRIVGSKGKLQAKEAEFTGKISAHEMISKKVDIREMKVSQTLDLEEKSNLNVHGMMKTDGDVLFSNGFKSMSHANVGGNMNVEGTLATKKIFVEQEIEVSTITFNRKSQKLSNKNKICIDATGGTIQADDLISSNSIQTNTLSCTSDINSSGTLKAEEVIASNFIGGKDLKIAQRASINNINSNSIEVNKTLSVNGLIETDSIKVTNDCAFQGLVAAKSIGISNDLKASRVHTSGQITADSIHSKRNLTTDGIIHSVSMELSGSMEVEKKITVAELNVTKILWGAGLSVSQLTVTDKLASKGRIETLGNITSRGDVFIGGDAHVTGDLNSKGVTNATNVTASDFLRSKGSFHCEEDANVGGKITAGGSISGASINVSGSISSLSSNISGCLEASFAQIQKNIEIGGNMIIPSILNATSESIVMKKPLVVHNSSVSILNDSLTVENMIITTNSTVKEILDANIISAKSMTLQGHLDVLGKTNRIRSSGGFQSSDGNLTCIGVEASGLLKSDGGLITTDMEVSGNARIDGYMNTNNLDVNDTLTVPKIFVTDSIASKSIEVSKSLHITKDGNLTSNSDVTFHKNAIVKQKIFAKEAEFEGAIKMKSAFASRMYTEDVVASGFLSAATISSKGDVNIQGEVVANSIAVNENINSRDVKVQNSFSCTTAQVHGILNSAGIIAQKITVKGDLILDGYNVREKISEFQSLKEKVMELETMVNMVMQKLK